MIDGGGNGQEEDETTAFPISYQLFFVFLRSFYLIFLLTTVNLIGELTRLFRKLPSLLKNAQKLKEHQQY